MHGRHCEAGTWGAGYIDGLREYLAPAGYLPMARTASTRARASASITSTPTRSSTSARAGPRISTPKQPKFKQSRLEQLLDILIAGTDEQVDALADALGEPVRHRAAAFRSHRDASPATRPRHAHELLPSVYVARDRHLHGHQDPDPAGGPARALPGPESRRLGHPDREPRSRASSRRPRLRGQAAWGGGDPRHRGPRRVRRLRARARGRVEARRSPRLPAVPLVLRGQAERARVPERAAGRVPAAYRETVGSGVYRTITYANAFLLIVGGAVPPACARGQHPQPRLSPERLRLADRRGHGRARARRPGRRLLHAADRETCSRTSTTSPASR